MSLLALHKRHKEIFIASFKRPVYNLMPATVEFLM